MEIKYTNNPTPTIFLENIFENDTIDLIHKELDLLNPNFTNPQKIGSAVNYGGQILKQNSGIFLNDVYANYRYSAIASNILKLISSQNDKILKSWNPDWLCGLWKSINCYNFLVSYYENNDHYLPHIDQSIFTFLIWLWKEPKEFSGGNLILNNPNNVIECKNNCGIIFPSTEVHSVTPIKLNNPGYGRYCITTFLTIDSTFDATNHYMSKIMKDFELFRKNSMKYQKNIF